MLYKHDNYIFNEKTAELYIDGKIAYKGRSALELQEILSDDWTRVTEEIGYFTADKRERDADLSATQSAESFIDRGYKRPDPTDSERYPRNNEEY